MLKRFAVDSRGGIGIMFAVLLMPLLLALGVAIEYSRATRTRADLQSAVDGAALAAGKQSIELTRKDASQVARSAFDASFRPKDGTTLTSFKAKQNAQKLIVEADARVPMMFARLLRQDGIEISARAEVPIGVMALEIALVLDNTGSMSRLGKMDALKEAAKNLIDVIQAGSGSGASIGLVPFHTQVNVGTDHRAAPWIRYTTTSAEPKLNVASADWTGCVLDRDQPEDARDSLPSTGRAETLYPAGPCQYPGLLPVKVVSRDFTGLKTAIDAMTPTGNTNTGIGLAWGLSLLTPGAPLSGSVRPQSSEVQKTIVFLTDGINTENRWSNDAVQIDQRTDRLCDRIKSNRIKIYTIRVIEGNESLLRNCASDPSMYYSVTQASELRGVFDKIAAELTTLRLSF